MRIVHLSDLHLGFRAFPRVERGWNLRERDVSTAVQQLFLEVARLSPDLVLVTGDLFDSPDPPSTAHLTLSRALSTFRAHAPHTPLLVIAGERDTPRTPADPGPVAVLDSYPGVDAAAGAPRAVHLRDLETHALLVPHRAALRPPFPELRPDPDARYNLLLLRGEPEAVDSEREGLAVDSGEWDYVAIGGGHRSRVIRENVRVAGSVERIGWDPWREATEEKGFILFDLGTGEGEFHPLHGRPVVDLAPVRTGVSEVEEGSRRLRHLLDGTPGGIEGKIVRVRLRGDLLSPDDGIASGLLSAIRRRAAHAEFHLTEGSEGEDWGAEHGTGRIRISGVHLKKPGGTSRLLTAPGGIVGVVATEEEGRVRVRAALNRSLSRSHAEDGSYPLLPRLAVDGGETGSSELEQLALFGDPDPHRLLRDGLAALALFLQENPELTASDTRLPGVDDQVEGEPRDEGTASTTNGPESIEVALRERRADLAEAAGDLEARTMEWAQERQDAESHLQAYRDRARELKQRLRRLEEEGADTPCPTCGRPIGSDLPQLIETLREEWESVVQDGRWWKMRRDQLDEKPEEIREMEGKTLRLQAELRTLEQAAGRAQEERHAAADPGEGENGKRVPDPSGSGETVEADEDPALSRELLRHAGRSLMRLTEGRVQGIHGGPTGLELSDRVGRRWSPSSEEEQLLSLVLQPALAAAARRRGQGARGMVLSVPSVLGAETIALRLLDSLPYLLPRDDTLVLILPPEAAARASERFRHLVEVRTDDEGRTTVRTLPCGRPRLHLT